MYIVIRDVINIYAAFYVLPFILIFLSFLVHTQELVGLVKELRGKLVL